MKKIRLSIYLIIVLLMYVAFRIYEWEQPPLPSIHTFVHRGGGRGMPENTLESVRFAWSLGMTPELNLRTTKDFRIVLFHDDDFKRLVSNPPPKHRGKGIKDYPYSVIKNLEVGSKFGKKFSGQKIPTLEAVFKEMKGSPERFVFLDVKKVYLDQLDELIREYKMENQVILTTDDYDILRRWRIHFPTAKTMFWIKGDDAQIYKSLTLMRKHGFQGLTHFQIILHTVQGRDEPFTVSREQILRTIKELRKFGIVLQVFPVQAPDISTYLQLANLGVKSFGTDYPMELVHFLTPLVEISQYFELLPDEK